MDGLTGCYNRYLAKIGNYADWNPSEADINGLLFKMHSEFKKGNETIKFKGQLFTDIDEGSVDLLVGNNYVTSGAYN